MSFFTSKIIWHCSVRCSKRLLVNCSRNTSIRLSRIAPLSSPIIYRYTSSDSKPYIEALSGLPFEDKEKGRIIYSGQLGRIIRNVKLFSLTTSVIALAAQPILIMSGDVGLFPKMFLGIIMNFFIFVTPLIIHFISKKYVTICYFNENTKEFNATTYSFFLRKKEHKFTADDIVVPDIPGLFTTIKAKGVALFLTQEDFYSKEAYKHMMGFDKPLDWRLPPKDEIDFNQSAENEENGVKKS